MEVSLPGKGELTAHLLAKSLLVGGPCAGGFFCGVTACGAL